MGKKFNLKTLTDTFIDLVSIYAPSGAEEPVQQYILPILERSMDSAYLDDYGNVLAQKRFGDGDAVVLLSAHMDSVPRTQKDRIIKKRGYRVHAEMKDGSGAILGADDRAGMAIIMESLNNVPEQFTGTIKIAFSREEEIGCVGANHIPQSFLSDVNLAIVVDRRGDSDIVVGCGEAFCSDDTGEYLKSIPETSIDDWSCVEGGVSDAFVFANLGINSVNLSAGYWDEHTDKECAHLKSMMKTVKLIAGVMRTIEQSHTWLGKVPVSNKWVRDFNFDRHTIADYEVNETFDDYSGSVTITTNNNQLCFKQGSSVVYMDVDTFAEMSHTISSELDKKFQVKGGY